MMASSSGSYKDGMNKQPQSSVSPTYNGGGSVHGEWGVPTFTHQQTVSMDWTPEEQVMLEEGLAKYATESNIICYAKIAVQIKTKTVRDVALRCRWMTKKEICKRRKDDINPRKGKDRKEKLIESSSAKPSRLSRAPGMASNSNDDNIPYNELDGPTRQLLQQNDWAFKQISTNLSNHKINENIVLLTQARQNLFKILANMSNIAPTTKRMPPLPKLNQELANSILPPLNLPIQL